MLHIRDSKCVCFKISLRRHVHILCAIDFIFLICSTYYTSVVLANVVNWLEHGEPSSRPISDDIDQITAHPSKNTSSTVDAFSNIPVSNKPSMILVAAVISYSLQIFLHGIQISLVLTLLYGIQKDILSCCKIWFTATILLSIIITISLIVNLSGRYFIVPTVITVLYIAYKIYMLWIVKLYTKRLVLYLIHFKQSNDEEMEEIKLY